MCTRQYIGARYVPKIFDNNGSAEWVKGIAYEPLTIVTYLNNSFTSKKPVPSNIGNPADNNEFWVNTANFNAQLEDYKNAVNRLNEELNNYKAETNANITEIENKLEPLISRKYALWIGDSYVEGNSLGDDKDKRFSTLVSKRLGVTELNYGKGGTGYAVGTNETNFLGQLTKAKTENAEIIGDIKYVFICGGRNDANGETAVWSNTQIQSVVYPTFSYAVNNFPSAKIVVIPMLFSAQNLYKWCVNWYWGVLNCTAGEPNMVILDNAYMILHGRYDLILSDTVHPNKDGHRLIATAIFSALNGGSFITNSYKFVEDTDTWNGKIIIQQNKDTIIVKGNLKPKSEISGWFIDQQNIPANAHYPAFIGASVDCLFYGADGSVVTGQISYYRLVGGGAFRVYAYQPLRENVVYSLSLSIPAGMSI